MTAIDARMATRRHTVREAGARRRLRKVLSVVSLFLAAGLIALLLRSPALAIRSIDIAGATQTDVASLLETKNVRVGVPTVSVNPRDIELETENDPWVARVQATVTWPGTLEIVVLEHQPIAWVKVAAGWLRVSVTGVIVEKSEPAAHGSTIDLGSTDGAIGEVVEDPQILAAVEFLALLSDALRRDASVSSGGAGTLTARIDGHLVDLGAPTDMASKAAAVEALVEQVPQGAAISVVSPLRPAIRKTQLVVQG